MMWRLILWGGGGLLVAVGLVWAVALGLPQRATHELAVTTAAAGFTVRQIEIAGISRQPRLAVYEALLSGGTDAMAGIDLAEARTRLLALPWVADARIERRWPGTLRVAIVEKKPMALWQHRGVIRLIDRTGEPLPADDLREFAHLPLVVGPGANAQAAELQALATRAPALFRHLRAATWIGGRRWDLRMASGETVSLPEGAYAGPALERLAAIDRATPILGRGFVRFDLRIPDKLVVRVSREAGAIAKPRDTPPASAPAAPARPAAAVVAAANPREVRI
jgi:cell division protein FtsQ